MRWPLICLGFEAGIFLLGFVILIVGKVKLNYTQVVKGASARLLGFLFMVPLGVYIAANVISGISPFATNPDRNERELASTIFLVGVGCTVACFLFALVLAFALAQPIEQAKKRSRGDEDHDDDRPRRRRDEEEEDDSPRRRRVDDEKPDDDRPTRQPVKRSSGGGKTLLIVLGSIAAVLLLACGATVGGIWYAGYRANKALVAEGKDFEQVNKQRQEEMQKNPAGGGRDPLGGKPVASELPPTNIDEALAKLQSKSEVERRLAARWLSEQPIDIRRQDEVSKALDPLIEDESPAVRSWTSSALNIWVTSRNVESLVRRLDGIKGGPLPVDGLVAMDLLARLKDERGAPVVAKFLNDQFNWTQAAGALKNMGPVAEKTVLSYYNQPNSDIKRSTVQDILSSYKTADEKFIRQTMSDLRSPDNRRQLTAAQSLSNEIKVNESLRPDVTQALKALLLDRDNGLVSAAIKALGKWGTKEGAELLAPLLGTNRPQAGDALIMLGQQPTGTYVAAVVKPYLQHENRDIKLEAKRVLSKLNPDQGGD
jgi:hypothetical protein